MMLGRHWAGGKLGKEQFKAREQHLRLDGQLAAGDRDSDRDRNSISG